MAGERDPTEETVERAKGEDAPAELGDFREKLRYVAAFALLGGLALDRIGPALHRDWAQYSDMGLLLVLAAILILLGERGLAAVFERWIKR